MAHGTRFSDGSFPVFYSALEPETAAAEIKYRVPKIVGTPNRPRTVYYSRFSCDFDGSVKDLLSKHVDWHDLTHDSDYSFCNRLGAEAINTELDGLVVPSARRSGGVNLPVFKRRAISNPVIHAIVAVTFDPATRGVVLTET
ncbi:MAG: RES family NAD+ phosphorylase [Halocynthiibacter sp.]